MSDTEYRYVARANNVDYLDVRSQEWRRVEAQHMAKMTAAELRKVADAMDGGARWGRTPVSPMGRGEERIGELEVQVAALGEQTKDADWYSPNEVQSILDKLRTCRLSHDEHVLRIRDLEAQVAAKDAEITRLRPLTGMSEHYLEENGKLYASEQNLLQECAELRAKIERLTDEHPPVSQSVVTDEEVGRVIEGAFSDFFGGCELRKSLRDAYVAALRPLFARAAVVPLDVASWDAMVERAAKADLETPDGVFHAKWETEPSNSRAVYLKQAAIALRAALNLPDGWTP